MAGRNCWFTARAKAPATAPTPISAKQENPIEISAEQQGDGALLTLKILGQYSASLAISICDWPPLA